MYNYFRLLDRKINDTLNIYQDIGKISIPLFKYTFFIFSLLIITSCFSIIYSLIYEKKDKTIYSSESIWINYSLPIIMYGILCPIISSIITFFIKFILDLQLVNIVNRYKFIKKKYGKYPNFITEVVNIFKYSFFNKYAIFSPSLILVYYINSFTLYIFTCVGLLFYILIKVFNYYNTSINCKIIGLEKCNRKNETFWKYIILIKYPNENPKIIKKRFNDFKKLHFNLNIIDSLPTSNWIETPLKIENAKTRVKELNKYLEEIIISKKALTNSIFYNFFNINKHNNSNIIISNSNNQNQYFNSNDHQFSNENINNICNTNSNTQISIVSNDNEDFININQNNINNLSIENNYITPLQNNDSVSNEEDLTQSIIINDSQIFNSSEIILETEIFDNNYDIQKKYIEKLNKQFSKLLDDTIIISFILFEINYYTMHKKRFYIFSNDFFYKLKLDKLSNKFLVRYKVPLNNIYKIEKTIIKNTTYLTNKKVLILNFGYNGDIIKLYLTSMSDDYSYNINGIFNYIKNNIEHCNVKTSNSHIYDNGYGISETIFNNKLVTDLKFIINKGTYFKKYH